MTQHEAKVQAQKLFRQQIRAARVYLDDPHDTNYHAYENVKKLAKIADIASRRLPDDPEVAGFSALSEDKGEEQ